MADIFISYSSKDRAAIKRISGFFESEGWTTWWDRQIPIAESFEDVLMAELARSKCVVVVWSKNSVKSPWVKREVELALSSKKLVPVLLRPVNIPDAFKHIETAFPDSWLNTVDNDEMHNLLGSIRKLVAPGNNPVDNPGTIPATHPGETPGTDPVDNPATYPVDNPATHPGETPATRPVDRIVSQPKAEFKKDYSSHVRRTWSINHTKLLIGVFLVLIFYILYLFVLRGWGLDYFKTLRFAIFFLISAGILYSLFTRFCIDKNIIAPRLSHAKQTSTWLIPVIFFVINIAFLPVANIFRIHGTIQAKNGQPVNDAQISIDGTPYYSHSLMNGAFSLELSNYRLGDKVVLHINHDEFEDTESGINLSTFVIKDARIVLNPIDSSILTLNHEK